MVTLQILFTGEQNIYAREMLIKAQGSFQMEGEKYTIGRTILRVLEEWCKYKGYIRLTKSNSNGNLAKDLIRNDIEEFNFILDLIGQVKRDPNEGNGRMLHEYLLRMEPDWRPPKGVSFNMAVLSKMEELMEVKSQAR